MMTREFAPHSRGLFGFGNSLRELFNTPRQLSEILIHGKPLSDEERTENQRRYYAQVKAENERLENERLEKRNQELKTMLAESSGETSIEQQEVNPASALISLQLIDGTVYYGDACKPLEPRLAKLMELLWDGQYHSLGELIEGTTGNKFEAKDLKNDLKNWVYELNCSLKEVLGHPPSGRQWVIRKVEKDSSGYLFKKNTLIFPDFS